MTRPPLMKKNVTRAINPVWYRFLHWPIWIWVFFVLPGHLTSVLFREGPDRRHAAWLGLVVIVTAWRGLVGRLPGVEPRPYVIHFGEDKPNLAYRVVCYTAAWIDLLVPFTLNAIGLCFAAVTGDWILTRLWTWLYYPLAALVVVATAADVTPRARRSTWNEGAERAWFYTAIWSVVPAQITAWAAWRLAAALQVTGVDLARVRLGVFALTALVFLVLSLRGRMPRTEPYRAAPPPGRGEAVGVEA